VDTFLIDSQTIDDLHLFEGTKNDHSVYAYFDYTTTIGGRAFLKELFTNPISDTHELADRNKDIQFLFNEVDSLSFQRDTIDFIEYFLHSIDKPKKYSFYGAFKKSVKYRYAKKQEQYNKQRGLNEILNTLAFLKEFCNEIEREPGLNVIKGLRLILEKVCSDPFIKKCMTMRPKKLKGLLLEKCDFFIRNIYLQDISEILASVYQLDAYFAIALAAKKHKFSFPIYHHNNESKLVLEGVFHPFLNTPIVNDFQFDKHRHLCFLTGVNMSGKSTLMKSIAVAIYLAHIGFPVPARRMETGLFNGLLTTINLPDNLTLGRSHFYNEVLRVKFVAQQIAKRKNLFIIFDELFRGTNVKDAYESSLLIIEAFSKVPTSFFIISSHLVEVAHDLKDNKYIDFRHFQTKMVNNTPTFNYKLIKGITDNRIGAWILKNEGILEILDQVSTKPLS
jgi:DNA mismatch repair protein MutS